MRLIIPLVILLLLLALFPKSAQCNSIVEKFPSTTSVIVAGWTQAPRVYIRDYQYADTSTNGAWQSYSGFGFNFNASDIIESVHINFARYMEYQAFVGLSYFILWVNNSDGWLNFNIDPFTADYSNTAYTGDECILSVEVTDVYESISNLNHLSISMMAYFEASSGYVHFYVDMLSVQIAYTTTQASDESFIIGLLGGGVISGAIGLVAILAKRRTS